MNCSHFETLLSDLLEERLDAPVAQAMERHLGECLRCSSLRDEVIALREALQAFPQLPPPAHLTELILEKTSGKPKKRSFWQDLFLPTIRPFLTQRFAFATTLMFVFLSLMVNLLGPGFSTLSYSALRPAQLAERADRLSVEFYKQWTTLKDWRARVWEELKLMKEDLYGRIDYHLITLLFKTYNESLEEQPETLPESVPDEGSQERQ